MGILIGMDEAGYGPNLGPLVVAATAWEVADEVSDVRHGESSIRCQVSDV
jgi:ribonuclease HII